MEPLDSTRSGDTIHGERVDLVLLSGGVIDAVLSGELEPPESMVDFTFPPNFPDDGDLELLRFRGAQLRATPAWAPWLAPGIVRREDRALVGLATFHGPPGFNDLAAPHAAELGYATNALYRNRGYATDAARAMLNVCPRCGEYSTDQQIEPSGPFAVCAFCGFRQKFLRLPLFVVTGANGTGKSTVARHLVGGAVDYVCLDGDVLWEPRYQTREDGFAAFRNLLLRVAKNISQSGRPVVLMAGGIPDQFEASPERRYFAHIHYLALVCDDRELLARLGARPAWRESGNPEVLARERAFNQWLRQNGSTTVPPMTLVESCAISETETARRVADWIASASGTT